MKFYLISFILIPFLSTAQQVIHLDDNDQLPTLTVFQPHVKKQSNTTAVIICPGGAYAFRSDKGEGVVPAGKLNEAGICAFLLDYRHREPVSVRRNARIDIAVRRRRQRLFHSIPADPHQPLRSQVSARNVS